MAAMPMLAGVGLMMVCCLSASMASVVMGGDADANACSASTDESKTTGADGEFWCINRGTIGGSAGECSCTCKTGYSGDHCQTANPENKKTPEQIEADKA